MEASTVMEGLHVQIHLVIVSPTECGEVHIKPRPLNTPIVEIIQCKSWGGIDETLMAEGIRGYIHRLRPALQDHDREEAIEIS